MEFITKPALLLAALAALAGCAATPAPTSAVPANVAPAAITGGLVSAVPDLAGAIGLQPTGAQPATVIADMGHGSLTPARLSLHINLGKKAGYGLMDSTPGVRANVVSDLAAMRFYLFENASAPTTVPTAAAKFDYALTLDNITAGHVDITFSNVKANSTGKAYYVAAAGFDGADPDTANNITNLSAPATLQGTGSKYYISNSGGSGSGAVRVTPVSYVLSGTDALGVPLKLLNAVAPILDAAVSVTDGDEITGDPGAGGQ
ncbi:MAG: hypothetical protein JWM80_4763 [Cyanobacteria bacterium RYN_339]|nr:hypothetical protein [Cyanobacteria bacterium RYN_339]